MKECVAGGPECLILYDSEAVSAPDARWLQPEWWIAQGAVQAELGGRGRALVVQTPAGAAVLRRFCRGGWMAPLLKDRYWRLAHSRSRAFREFRLLSQLLSLDLPVPQPLAASFEPAGPFYRAGLLTQFLPGTRQLADLADELTAPEWMALASVLRRFFDAGLVHPDLNARNLLMNARGQWFVLDLDRAHLRGGPIAAGRMIERLARSLRKHAGTDWQAGFEEHLRSLG